MPRLFCCVCGTVAWGVQITNGLKFEVSGGSGEVIHARLILAAVLQEGMANCASFHHSTAYY
jgi:hypothetical protein